MPTKSSRWRLPRPASLTIRNVSDSWIQQAFEAGRNAVVVTARMISIDEATLRDEVARRGMTLPRPDRCRHILGGLTKRELLSLLAANSRNACDVAAILGVGTDTLTKRAKALGVVIEHGYRRWDPSADTLRRLYWDEGLTSREIGVMYGVNQPTVIQRMVILGVPRRPRSGPWACKTPEARAARIENARRGLIAAHARRKSQCP